MKPVLIFKTSPYPQILCLIRVFYKLLLDRVPEHSRVLSNGAEGS